MQLHFFPESLYLKTKQDIADGSKGFASQFMSMCRFKM